MPTAQRVTAREFLAEDIPRASLGRNLVDGRVIVNQARILHEDIQGEIYTCLRAWAHAADGRGRVCIPIDVMLDEHNVYVPDVLWYSDGRVPDRHADPPYELPDLAVEIRSPGTWSYDIGPKKSGYEVGGLPELWLVDTEAEQVLVFRRSAGASSFDELFELRRDQVLRSPLLPGFELPLGQIFY